MASRIVMIRWMKQDAAPLMSINASQTWTVFHSPSCVMIILTAQMAVMKTADHVLEMSFYAVTASVYQTCSDATVSQTVEMAVMKMKIYVPL